MLDPGLLELSKGLSSIPRGWVGVGVACEGPGVDKWLYSGTRVEAGVISVILVQRPPREGQVGPGGQRCSLRTLDPPPPTPSLLQIGVFSPSLRNHYLNVTPNNLVHVYSPDAGEGDILKGSQSFPKVRGAGWRRDS